MSIDILMPALSPTMEEGKLARWLVKEGDEVASGDILAEIETDKATMEYEAVDEGTIGRILISEGTEGVKVNTPIAVLLEDGEDLEDLGEIKAAPAKVEKKPEPEKAKSEPAPDKPKSVKPEPAKPEPAKSAAPAAPAAKAPPAPKTDGERVFASPLARRLADQDGIDIASVKGSGPHGRIVKADVEAAKASGTGKKAVAPAAGAAAPSGEVGGYTEVPNSMMRKVIARRLSESKQTVPHFYLTVDCRIDALLAARKQINDQAADMGIKVSVNDMVIKAVALALKKVPDANASWTDDAIRLYNDVDISMAVATEKGLITPIIRSADKKGLGSIASEAKELAGRAREGKLKPEEFQGGGFSISNLGMYGVREFAAIINPPQSCILAVGAGEQRPVVENGQLAVGTVMSCTLSVDHRSVDGAVGAEFLQAFKGFIENPMSMLL